MLDIHVHILKFNTDLRNLFCVFSKFLPDNSVIHVTYYCSSQNVIRIKSYITTTLY